MEYIRIYVCPFNKYIYENLLINTPELTSWESGKSLIWDVACIDAFTASHEAAATSVVGAVAEEAEERKKHKYIQ